MNGEGGRWPGPGDAGILESHLQAHDLALASLRRQSDVLERWACTLAARLGSGARLFAAGNGGSAAQAQHLTAELVGRFHADRAALSAICLGAETSGLTAILNDYGPNEVFARQVRAHGRSGDVIILLSTSGASSNLLHAALAARESGLSVWALTGPGGNPLADLADEALTIDISSAAAVQEAHLVGIHLLCTELEHWLAQSPGDRPGRAESPETEPLAAGTGSFTALPRLRRGRPTVVVVGDVLLDQEIDGTTHHLASSGPTPVLVVDDTKESPGGAGLTALLCAVEAVHVRLVAPIADDDAGGRLLARLTERMDVLRLPHLGDTRTKARVSSDGCPVLRLDRGGPGTPGDIVLEDVRRALADADVVLVSDYGGGITVDPGIRTLLEEAAGRCPLVWDPHPCGGPPVRGAALVTPNIAEARTFLRTVTGSADNEQSPFDIPVDALASTIRQAWTARAVCVTAGPNGAYLALAGSEPMYIPTHVHQGDTCGAGDQFAASAAVSLATGAVLSEAVLHAVKQATAWVAADGPSGFRARSMRPAPALPERAALSLEAVRRLVETERIQGHRIVATGGCFDLLHVGHVALLEAAATVGDLLVVLVNSDASVRRLKGPGRPVISAEERALMLLALKPVDAVVVFEDDDPCEALSFLRPDVWVKGGDYGGAPMPEADLVRSWGGRVLLLPYARGASTTGVVARMRELTF